jgi:hypothetical protein
MKRYLGPCIFLCSLILTLAFAEISSRVILRLAHDKPERDYRICEKDQADCPFVYSFYPKHEGINSYGFVGPEVTNNRNKFRVELIGDSVSYGVNIPDPMQSFPWVMMRLVEKRGVDAELLNASVPGWTLYNYQKALEGTLETVKPNVVIVSLCLNDIADPWMHWYQCDDTSDQLDIPPAAIPNQAYHAASVEPRLRAMRISKFYCLLQRWLFIGSALSGRAFDTYIVGEDAEIGIERYSEKDSVEWRWMQTLLKDMQTKVEKAGAKFAIMVNPLKYQLNDGSDRRPQELIQKFCNEQGIPYFDPLPELKSMHEQSHEVFIEKNTSTPADDIWHYNLAGHLVVGKELERFLREQNLIPMT